MNDIKNWIHHYYSWYQYCQNIVVVSSSMSVVDVDVVGSELDSSSDSHFHSNVKKQKQTTAKHNYHKIVRYEHITNLTTVASIMEDVVEFVGNNHSNKNNLQLNHNWREKTIIPNFTAVIRVPDYIPGTLFKEICGVEAARRLYNLTKYVSEDLFSYPFNYQDGIWIIPPPAP